MEKNNLMLFPLLLVLYETITYLANDAYLPALPVIMGDLATTRHLVQLTLTTWFIGASSMQLILGPIADRYGRRPVLLLGGTIFIFSTVICALATNIWVLLFFRFLQGATIASLFVAGYAAIHELFDHKTAINTTAWMSAISSLSTAFGPLLGAVSLHYSDWRWTFGMLAILGSIILSALFFKMPETNLCGFEHTIDIKRITKQYKSILLNFACMRPALSFCFLFSALIAWLAAGPFLIITEFHRSTYDFGLLQLLIFGSYIVGTRFVKPMMQKYRTANLIRTGLIIALIGGLSSGFALVYQNNLILIVIPLILIAVGTGFCAAPLTRSAIEASSEPMGAKLAIFTTLQRGFAVLSTTLTSVLYKGSLISLAIVLLTFSVAGFLLNWINPKNINAKEF